IGHTIITQIHLLELYSVTFNVNINQPTRLSFRFKFDSLVYV
uniref:Uncharacterized protein n=1 Tax=Amphimedon queenslandica TaxID=400682 RepID=A0A1X7V160_AMPQE